MNHDAPYVAAGCLYDQIGVARVPANQHSIALLPPRKCVAIKDIAQHGKAHPHLNRTDRIAAHHRAGSTHANGQEDTGQGEQKR